MVINKIGFQLIPCDRAYIEKISGKNTDRPELQAMLLNIRSGDILNIHEMSRLARNTRDLPIPKCFGM